MRLFPTATPPTDSGPVNFLVARADLDAERIVAWTRIVLGAAFLLALLVTLRRYTLDELYIRSVRRTAALAGLLLIVTGVASLKLLKKGLFRGWMSYVFVAADAALVAVAVTSSLHYADVSANFMVLSPPIFAIPIVLAVGALRYRPMVQVFSIACLTVTMVIGAWWEDFAIWPTSGATDGIQRFISLPPYVVRALFLFACGAITILVIARARRLLLLAVEETVRRATLTRFLPSEIAPMVSSDRFAELRRGRRQHAIVMFVDIRGSTGIAADLDPHRLSIFIASFRRRVMAATQAHGGVVDKFIGDGALIVFGLPEPAADDARRALDCGLDILARVARWNAKRSFDPPLAVGVGIHAGDVYFGVVGDRDRMELTVLGDAVNVASRLEEMTKTHPSPILASEVVVREAGADDAWYPVSNEPVRGREGAVRFLGPKALAPPAGAPSPDLAPGGTAR